MSNDQMSRSNAAANMSHVVWLCGCDTLLARRALLLPGRSVHACRNLHRRRAATTVTLVLLEAMQRL